MLVQYVDYVIATNVRFQDYSENNKMLKGNYL